MQYQLHNCIVLVIYKYKKIIAITLLKYRGYQDQSPDAGLMQYKLHNCIILVIYKYKKIVAITLSKYWGYQAKSPPPPPILAKIWDKEGGTSRSKQSISAKVSKKPAKNATFSPNFTEN